MLHADVDRTTAFVKACEIFGEGAVVGLDAHEHETPFSVGKRWHGRWLVRGLGTSWQDAFEHVVEYAVPRSERG